MQATQATDRHTMTAEALGAFASRLAARAEAAEALRRLPDETVAEARAMGFFEMVVPRRWGGAEASFPEFFDAVRRMAQGCASSAWTLSFLALHSWLACRFSARFQEEAFAAAPYALMPAPLAPTGQAIPCEGGFRVSGRWEWATGIMHSDWVMVNCIEPGAKMGPRFCILPLSEVAIDDVWRVAGMAATGSNTVVVADRFVPEHRTLEGWRIKFDQSEGLTLHPDCAVGFPMVPVLALTAAAPALGAAEGALAAFETRMKEKIQAYSGKRQLEVPATHLRFGEALASLKAARLVYADAVALLQRIGPLGAKAPVGSIAEIRLAASHVVRLAGQTVDTLAAAAGASSGFLHSPIQRALRDIQMIRGHVIFDWDRTAQLGGKIALGIEPGLEDML